MNDTPDIAPAPVPAPRSRYRVWMWIGFSFLGLFLLSVAGVASMFFLDGDAASLRDEMRDSRENSSLQTRVQFSLGSISLGLVRAAIGRLDGVDDEARLALSAVRAVSVGVYSVSSDDARRISSGFDFSHLDKRMKGRGWERIVAVREQGKLVLIYAPSDAFSRRTLPLCLGVLDGDTMVIVSLRGDPEPILKIASLHQSGYRF